MDVYNNLLKSCTCTSIHTTNENTQQWWYLLVYKYNKCSTIDT